MLALLFSAMAMVIIKDIINYFLSTHTLLSAEIVIILTFITIFYSLIFYFRFIC